MSSQKNAGKAVLIERNYEMINKSEFCIVYYNEKYLPPKRKYSRNCIFDYHPKSGTGIAYNYAVKNSKYIVNLFDMLDK